VTTKLHLAMTAEGHIVEAMLTAGNTADITVADELTSEVVECYVIEDKGYDSDAHRATLQSNNNVPVIPGRKNRKVPVVYDKILYRLRGGIERFFGKIKENKRVSQRYDKEDNVFLSFIALATFKVLFNILIS
jgi:transposase